jgi:hypothetical protein
VQALDFAGGLWVVGLGVGQRDAEGEEFAFEGDPAAAAVVTGEDRGVVGEQAFGAAVAGHRGVQVGDDVAGFEHCAGGAAGEQSGVVVDDVEDLNVGAVREWPVGDVGLPALVG